MTRVLHWLLALTAFAAAASACGGATLAPCRLKGIEREVLCGSIETPEDPDRPAGRRIAIRFAVVSALARNKAPDPVFVFAGGPGQAATRVAGLTQGVLAPLNARRDLVYVDQRGTGQSNPLACPREPRNAPLAQAIDPMRQAERLRTCLAKLDADLRQYATWIAMRDVDAVRAALGYEQINLWGGSYGTRAALEYLRQFPAHVRSAVLDGAAPPDMMLPASFSIDADAALARVTAACARDVDCAARYPRLAADLDRLLATLGGHAARAITVAHPLTGRRETLPLDRDTFAGLLRPPLYAPQLAALLPYALAEAATDNFAPLIALGTALGGTEDNFFEGMHFAVICAEDVPRLTAAAKERAARTRFGAAFTEMYERICRGVPARPVPAAFYDIPASKVPVLILSGGADPVTPPRYGDAVARKLGNARHLIAEHVGHGVSQQGCAPELVQRFIREAKVDAVDGACLAQLPAPRFFQPIAAP